MRAVFGDGEVLEGGPMALMARIGQPAPNAVTLEGVLIRTLDVILSAVLLVVLAPLLLLIVLAVKIEDPGPVFFSHRRIGRFGREFGCLKFRSMVVDADVRLRELLARDPEMRAEWAISRKLRNDPRITRIGNFLRKSSLDELPQLMNVLRGEMSLVGPRPIISSETPLYGRYIAAYHTVRPGITGLWQISGRNDVCYRRRVALDVLYTRSRSVKLYMLIILRTPVCVLASRGVY
jgi:lipopolysaccharide/colanic/teichoic acid biosynthesis glycosyltransferase